MAFQYSKKIVHIRMAIRKTRRYRKRKQKRTRNRYYTRYKGGSIERTYVFLIPYRAKSPEERRRDELKSTINSIDAYFNKYNKKYAIYIAEEHNDYPFNRGFLLNAAFLEAEKKYTFPRIYIHMNADYTFDMSYEFPTLLDEFDGNGFMDIFTANNISTIGGMTCFGADTYKKVNGFPNIMYGWGYEDNALRIRADTTGVPVIHNNLLNNGWIIAKGSDDLMRNMSHQEKNRDMLKIDVNKDGLNTCVYTIDGVGEFNNTKKNITHSLINWDRT